MEPFERLLAIRALIDMHAVGDLSTQQTLNAIAIETGQTPRSEESLSLGIVIQKVADGRLPAQALTTWLEEHP